MKLLVQKRNKHTPSLESQVLGWRSFQPCCTACSGWSKVIQAKADTDYSLITAAMSLFPVFSYLLAEGTSHPLEAGMSLQPQQSPMAKFPQLCSPTNVAMLYAQQGLLSIAAACPLDHSCGFTHHIHLPDQVRPICDLACYLTANVCEKEYMIEGLQ